MRGKTGKYISASITTALLLFLIFISPGCEPFEDVSDIPAITFKNFELFQIDTLSNTIYAGKLVFDFIDGDADIGVYSNASMADSNNFYLVPSYKLDGNYFPLGDTLKYQIRHNEKLDRTGQYKTIKGEISLIIYYFIIPSHDTIRYDFYIKDRALNKSNIATTSDIGFF